MNFGRQSARLVISCVIAYAAASCTADEPLTDRAATEATASTASSELRPLLQPFEDLATELEARDAAGQLAPDWRAAWAAIHASRQDEPIAQLASLLRGTTPDQALLAIGTDAIGPYIRSFDAAVKQLEMVAAQRNLDPRMAALYDRLAGALQQGERPDLRPTRARNFCCVVHQDVPEGDPVPCFQWHTAAILAGPRCVAKGIGLHRTGSTLYGGICQDHPECFPH